MNAVLPVVQVPRRPLAWGDPTSYASWPWRKLQPLPPFMLANGHELAEQQTEVRLCFDATHLYVCFDCEDRHIWGDSTTRDAPIFDEEVVELFIAPGAATPVDYFEFEISPLGTLLDLTAHNPDGDRRTMHTDFTWNCPNLLWQVERDDAHDHWRAYLVVPWRSLLTDGPLPNQCRANFYRIERPAHAAPEFSCWSPTYSEPADYHIPAYFGTLHLDESRQDASGKDMAG